MSNFTKRRHLSEENSEEIVNNSEDSGINGDSDMSSENKSRPIFSKVMKMTALMMGRQKAIFSMVNCRKQGYSCLIALLLRR